MLLLLGNMGGNSMAFMPLLTPLCTFIIEVLLLKCLPMVGGRGDLPF